MELLIGALIGAFITATYYRYIRQDECPRMYIGYNCKGSECDHSYKAMQDVRRDFDL